MKKYAYIPTMLALVFLVSNCTLPPVHDPAPAPRTEKDTKTVPSSPPENPAAAVRPETKGKRVSLIAKDNTPQTAPGTAPDKTTAPTQDQDTQPAPSLSP